MSLFAEYKKATTRRLAHLGLGFGPGLDTPERGAKKHAALRSVLQHLDVLQKLPELNYVHVTGTSGKGSVSKLIHDILVADGRKTGGFFTPYTTTHLESFYVNDHLVDPRLFIQSINEVSDATETLQLDVNTNIIIALNTFLKAQVDWAVIEVGRGGRFDSTNIIPSPQVAVITSVDLDHTATLGPKLEDIAWQKAGIIKPGCHVVCGERRPELQTIFLAEAKAVGATIEFVPWHENYLEQNRAIATAVTRYLGVPLATIDRAIEASLGLPCRFEIVQEKPRVILDGAHNPAKMKATIERLSKETRGELTVLFGCKSTKNGAELLAPLLPLVKKIHTTKYLHGAGQPTDPQELLRLIPETLRGIAYDSSHHAVSECLGSLSADETLLVTGSLYLAGEIRAHWVSEQMIVERQSSYRA